MSVNKNSLFISLTETWLANHYDADFNLRKDALLVGHQRELLEVEHSIEKRKQRGR